MYMNNNQNTEAQLRAAIELKLWCQSYEVKNKINLVDVSILKKLLFIFDRRFKIKNYLGIS